MKNLAVQLEKISKSFGKNEVLKGITLNLEQGKFYTLLGKNGSGKSTLMRILMKYEQPDSGRGAIFNQELAKDSNDLNLDIGYVSETLDYILPIQIKKLFGSFAGIYPRWDQNLFDSFLNKLLIDQKKYFRELSRGQKMQVAFASAMAIHPKLVILDEITSVLDASARSFFMAYLGQFTKDGGTVLMSTNLVSEVQNYASHIVLISEGQVKLALPISEVAKSFCKLKKMAGTEHEIFKNDACLEVGLNSDNSTSYLIPVEYMPKGEDAEKILEEFLDRRGITTEEIFIYYTRNRGV